LRSRIEKLKKDLANHQYKHIEELKALKLEQRKIEARMKENKQKATNEKDPAKKALLLQLIEDDGGKLKENLEKQKAIPTYNLRFEPDKYVNDLIESMKNGISGNDGRGSGSGGSGRNRKTKNQNNGNDEDDNNTDPEDNSHPEPPEPEKNETNKKNQQQLILIASITLLIFLYFYSQPSKKEPNYYDF
jgi:hypothetical protein